MALNRIEDWDAILGPLQPASDKPAETSKKLDRNATAVAALNGESWHENVLRLVASWVSKGNTDEEIYALAATITMPGYTVEQSLKDVQPMIDGARNKGFGSTKIDFTSFTANTPAVRAILDHSDGEIQQGGSYFTFKRQLHFVDFKRSKPIDIKLCNFTAEIGFETTKLDGRDSVKTFSVQGQLYDGTPLPLVEVDAASFDKLDWLTQNWGAKPQVAVIPRSRDHVAAAIKYCSKPIEKVIYRHTGWITESGKYVYLSATGGISANGLNDNIETELQGILASYDLPPPSDNGVMNFTASLEQFERLIDGGNGLLLVGAAFRSVLSEFEPCTVSVFLQGTTGAFKSAIAGCLQAFFGKKFHGAHLPENWSSTGNAIEKKAFLAKDTLFTVDDFVARGTPSEVSRLHKDAERVLRAQGNQSGRDRLTSTTEIRGAYVPRGLILATGEDIPNGHSLQARCLIMSINKGATDTATLSKLQNAAASGQLSQIMSDFIRWAAEQADEGKIKKHLSRVHAECKEHFTNKGHTRMGDNLATSLSGLWLLLEFANERASLSGGKVQQLKSKAISAAQNLAQLQVSVDQEGSEAERFVALLQSALSMCRAHMANKDGNQPYHYGALGWKMIGTGEYQKLDGQGPRIGWLDDDCVYLDPKAALSVIKPLSSQIGNYLGSSERAISKALQEANMLAKYEAGRTTTKVTVEGRRKPLLCLPLNLFIEEDETPPKETIQPPEQDDFPF
jgi:hypothetical protein